MWNDWTVFVGCRSTCVGFLFKPSMHDVQSALEKEATHRVMLERESVCQSHPSM